MLKFHSTRSHTNLLYSANPVFFGPIKIVRGPLRIRASSNVYDVHEQVVDSGIKQDSGLLGRGTSEAGERSILQTKNVLKISNATTSDFVIKTILNNEDFISGRAEGPVFSCSRGYPLLRLLLGIAEARSRLTAERKYGLCFTVKCTESQGLFFYWLKLHMNPGMGGQAPGKEAENYHREVYSKVPEEGWYDQMLDKHGVLVVQSVSQVMRDAVLRQAERLNDVYATRENSSPEAVVVLPGYACHGRAWGPGRKEEDADRASQVEAGEGGEAQGSQRSSTGTSREDRRGKVNRVKSVTEPLDKDEHWVIYFRLIRVPADSLRRTPKTDSRSTTDHGHKQSPAKWKPQDPASRVESTRRQDPASRSRSSSSSGKKSALNQQSRLVTIDGVEYVAVPRREWEELKSYLDDIESIVLASEQIL